MIASTRSFNFAKWILSLKRLGYNYKTELEIG